LTGITYEVSLQNQQVKVTGDVPYETVLEKIKRTGKEVGASSSHLFEAGIDLFLSSFFVTGCFKRGGGGIKISSGRKVADIWCIPLES
jgi:hypothetical protein